MNNNNKDHKILALKYRPKNFKELIGQDVMVETVTNSIKLNRLPNAYLLTGIRGVGKTTTARLIAKAINCEKNFIAEKSGEYCKCNSCEEIDNFKHLDVLEMDAASRTGIDDIRELIDSSKYNPNSAKYKIFIIDEVHMLSKQAFNGLLKTLEEPPPHLKFIFATTEVKKIPVTIISRCQRFDLHRVPVNILLNNLKKILEKETGKISDSALALIVKAAEGSVRDSLSLLDRALIGYHYTKKEVDDEFVRKMLGIADRSKILELIKSIFNGNEKLAIKQLRDMINEGIDPKIFLNEMLEIIYLIQQKKNLGISDIELQISEAEVEVIDLISKNVDSSTLIIFWQFILKGLEELNVVSNSILSIEMLVIKLIHLKDMPSYEGLVDVLDKNISAQTQEGEKFISTETKKNLIEEKNLSKISKDQIKNTTQAKPKLSSLDQENLNKDSNILTISTFEDLIEVSKTKKEIELKYDLEKNVNLIKFSEGKIDISFNINLGKDFVKVLSKKLLEWTGKRWVITLAKSPGQPSILQQKNLETKELLEKEKRGDIYKKFKNIFSDGELIEVLKKK
tara:strand:+ start:651 stop:2351 length:1701 start_codon:yes stop_codon:yes gene_type:complete